MEQAWRFSIVFLKRSNEGCLEEINSPSDSLSENCYRLPSLSHWRTYVDHIYTFLFCNPTLLGTEEHNWLPFDIWTYQLFHSTNNKNLAASLGGWTTNITDPASCGASYSLYIWALDSLWNYASNSEHKQDPVTSSLVIVSSHIVLLLWIFNTR